MDYLTLLYNKIWDSGRVPDSWSKIILRMLYKKGDIKDPSNYRQIALVNCITKVFTQILTKRLNDWVDANGLLPEHQVGFRKKRSCADHILTLNAIIQIRLNLKKGKLFVLFVDFRSAFPSVCHDLLWAKLHRLGAGDKIVGILKDLYGKAMVAVKGVNDLSKPTKVTKGVLQGESMSPILFCLFIADFEQFLKAEGIRGVSVDQLTEILVLAFADDIAILADSVSAMRRILKALWKYCQSNKLNININKTKIVIFRKGGHSHDKNIGLFSYGDKGNIDVVSNYDYLGVTFSNSSVYLNAVNSMISKANIAQFSTISLTNRVKLDSWSAVEKLFDSLVLSVFLYNAQIWSMRYEDEIESVQIQFFKTILLLPRCTPGYAVRLETNKCKLIATTFKLALNYIEKIFTMDNNRYPKICFKKLKKLSENNNVIIKYNWCAQIGEIFKMIDRYTDWQNITLYSIVTNKTRWINEYEDFLRMRDIKRLCESRSLLILPQLTIRESIQDYFKLCRSLKSFRIITQLRLLNVFQTKIIINNKLYNWKCDGLCGGCRLLVNDFSFHVLIECRFHNEDREKFINGESDESSNLSAVMDVLNNPRPDTIKKIIQFVEAIIAKRDSKSLCIDKMSFNK